MPIVPQNVSAQQRRFTARSYIPTTAAASDDNWPLLYAEYALRIVSGYVIFSVDVTGHATNYTTLTIQDRGSAGSGTTAACQLAFTAATTHADNTQVVLTNSTTAANLDIAAGSCLAFDKTDANSGLAIPDSIVVVEYEFTDQEAREQLA